MRRPYHGPERRNARLDFHRSHLMRWLPIPVIAVAVVVAVPFASASVTVSPPYIFPSCNTLPILNDPYPHGQIKTGSGNFGGTRPTFTNGSGILAITSDWANTGTPAGTASNDTQPWDSIGVGTTGTCISKSVATATGLLKFHFVSMSWTIQLWANCTVAGSSASASYNPSVGGDIFDYSNGGSWVLGANRPIGTPYFPANNPFTLSCSGASGSHYWTYTAPPISFTITSKVGGTLNAGDQYYFFEDLLPYVYATSSSDATSGSALALSTTTLAYATCPGC